MRRVKLLSRAVIQHVCRRGNHAEVGAIPNQIDVQSTDYQVSLTIDYLFVTIFFVESKTVIFMFLFTTITVVQTGFPNTLTGIFIIDGNLFFVGKLYCYDEVGCRAEVAR